MAAFTALALGLLGLAGGLTARDALSGGDDANGGRTTVGRTDPNAPAPLTTPPAAPPSTAQDAAAAVPAAQNAAARAKKRAAAGDTLLTSAQTPTQTAKPSVQPLKLLGA